jgi:transcriptional regulator with XRE-family HTH domain
MSELYNRIEGLCKAKGITITQMCREAKINRSTLSELHKGRTKTLSAKVSYKIATYFDVPLDYINANCATVDLAAVMHGKDKLIIEPDEKSTPADEISKSAHKLIDQLSDAELVKVDEYAKFLISQRGSDK